MTLPANRRWPALLHRFLAADSGGGSIEYALFAACWGAALSCGLYVGTPLLTAKLDTVSAAFRNGAFR